MRGYHKIKRCCEKALECRLQWAWVDTCCIDKTSSAELSESINSMFAWYADSKICFAYLEDVPSGMSFSAVESQFVSSRWHTRGWTLQELLAPSKLLFFSRGWNLLGARNEFTPQLKRITGIDEPYLLDEPSTTRGSILRKASIAERMSWAAKRKTRKVEDMAYCLLGIFGVSMPLIYGEGGAAYIRLQEEIIRHCFDPTILAWNVRPRDQILTPLRDEPLPIWSSVVKLLLQSNFPWTYNPVANTRYTVRDSILDKNAVTTLLAPSPEYFEGCGDIVSWSWGMDLDCDLTVHRLSIILPRSQDVEPYILIPCRPRKAPCNVLAVPLSSQGNSLFVRRPLPAKWMSHDVWHHWPQQRTELLLRRYDITNSPSPQYSFWVRSVAAGFRVKQVHPTQRWMSSGGIISPETDSEQTRRRDSILISLLLERQSDEIEFVMTLDVADATTWSLLNKISPWPCCHFTYYNPNKSLRETSKLHKEMGWGSGYLEFHDGITYVAVEKANLNGETIFSIDIKYQPHNHLTRLITIKCWLAARTSQFVLALPTATPYQVQTGKVLNLTLVLLECAKAVIARFAAIFIKRLVLRINPRLSDEVFQWWKIWYELFVVSYLHLPAISCFLPIETSRVREYRIILAFAIGSSAAILIRPLSLWTSINVLCGAYFVISLYSNKMSLTSIQSLAGLRLVYIGLAEGDRIGYSTYCDGFRLVPFIDHVPWFQSLPGPVLAYAIHLLLDYLQTHHGRGDGRR